MINLEVKFPSRKDNISNFLLALQKYYSVELFEKRKDQHHIPFNEFIEEIRHDLIKANKSKNEPIKLSEDIKSSILNNDIDSFIYICEKNMIVIKQFDFWSDLFLKLKNELNIDRFLNIYFKNSFAIPEVLLIKSLL